MNPEERNAVYRMAIGARDSGRTAEAIDLLRRLVAEGSKNPGHVSLLGLLMVTQGRSRREGLTLCQRAVVLGIYDPQVYFNLARAHAHLGQRSKAVHVLRKGLAFAPEHRGLLQAIEKWGPRRRPVVAALSRDHVLNRYLGRVRARLSG